MVTREAVGNHVPYPQQGHEAGTDCAVAVTSVRGTVFVATAGSAGQTGCCAAEVWGGYLCPWLLLASASGLFRGNDAQISDGVLDREILRECRSGSSEPAGATESGLEGDCGLGMPGSEGSVCGLAADLEGDRA